MTGTDAVLRLDDPAVVAEQYIDPARLSARQGIWSFRRPALDFVTWALGQVGLRGDELVLDVGCGNGHYLRALIDGGHEGLLVGLDISAGMLAAVPPRVGRLSADAQALPFADSRADLTLAMHMLYHAVDKPRTARELRRVTKRGGRVLVALSAGDTLRELHELIDGCASRSGLSIAPHDPGLTLDGALALFDGLFDTVRRVDTPGALHVTDSRAVLDYVASLSRVLRAAPTADQRERFLDHLGDSVEASIADDGYMSLTATSGCLVCQ